MPGKRKQTNKINEQIEETFPASDPPSFMGGEVLGAPEGRKSTKPARKKAKKAKKPKPVKAKAVTKARPKTVKKKKAATKKRKVR
jgi:hypothetical protein